MPVVKEIAESIKLLGDIVKSTREIVDAVNDGRAYLKRYYPEARVDLSNLLKQMQRAIEGLASVTKVISGFRFVLEGTSVERATADRDLARLNDYLIAQREQTSTLKGNMRELKADCDKVRQLRDKLDSRTKSHSWGSMFELFGAKARERSQELHSALSNFYADDQRMIELLSHGLAMTERALLEVEDALGPPGMLNPYNVPIAAEVLGLYSMIYRARDTELHSLADELSKACTAISA
jgi:chromosome segregation ATPase